MTKAEVQSNRFRYQIYATVVLFLILWFIPRGCLAYYDSELPAWLDDGTKWVVCFFGSLIISLIVYFASGFESLAKKAYPDE